MPINITDLLEIEGASTNLQISRREHRHIERFPAVDKYPLTKVKFLLPFNAEWSLNIFLNNFLLGSIRVFDYFTQLASAIDAMTTGVVRRLDNPNIVSSIDLSILGEELFQSTMQANYFELFVSRESGCRYPCLHKH